VTGIGNAPADSGHAQNAGTTKLQRGGPNKSSIQGAALKLRSAETPLAFAFAAMLLEKAQLRVQLNKGLAGPINLDGLSNFCAGPSFAIVLWMTPAYAGGSIVSKGRAAELVRPSNNLSPAWDVTSLHAIGNEIAVTVLIQPVSLFRKNRAVKTYRSRTRTRRLAEHLEQRLCLTAVAFETHNIECCTADGAKSVFAADLDGDGDLDVLSASYRDDKIAWYENTDGLGTFGVQNVITSDADGASSIFAADMDGDGDTDVLSASWYDGKIAWYENTDGLGTFGQQNVITTNATVAEWVIAADIDGDGDTDVLSASSNPIVIFGRIAW
jgi:hypothetical protein